MLLSRRHLTNSNVLYVFPQEVQKFFQNATTISCQIGFFNPITSDVFAFDIEGLHDNGCNVIQGANGDMICPDMVVVERGVQQGSVSFIEDHLSQGLQSHPCYINQDQFANAIAALVKLHKVSIIAIMHEYAYLGKDKFFDSSAPCKNIVTIKSMIVCPSLPYVIVMTDAEVDSMLLHDVCDVLICYHGHGPSECALCLPHLDNIGSSVSQAVLLWILLKGEQSQGEHSCHLDAPMSTSMEKSQVKYAGIESIVPPDTSLSEQFEGKLSPNQVKTMEMQAVRLDATIRHKTVHLFLLKKGSIIVFPKKMISALMNMTLILLMT